MNDLINMAELTSSAKWKEVISKKKKTQQWIPVSERLPEKEGLYLISHQSGKIFIDEWIDECGWSSFEAITAWMPLPEPYKGGDAE